MDKFTLFELHVHDGMDLSATNTAPAIGRSLFSKVLGDGDDAEDVEAEAYEELEEVLEDEDREDADADVADERDDDDASSGPGPLGLVVGLVLLAVLAFAIRKFRGDDTELEIAELDDLNEELDEEEAEH